jgi:hypothetical protein
MPKSSKSQLMLLFAMFLQTIGRTKLSAQNLLTTQGLSNLKNPLQQPTALQDTTNTTIDIRIGLYMLQVKGRLGCQAARQLASQ